LLSNEGEKQMKHIVYGATKEEKDAAFVWLQSVADDTEGANSAHATILKKILDYYIEHSGDLV